MNGKIQKGWGRVRQTMDWLIHGDRNDEPGFKPVETESQGMPEENEQMQVDPFEQYGERKVYGSAPQPMQQPVQQQPIQQQPAQQQPMHQSVQTSVQQAPQQPGNVVNFPGTQNAADGSTYAHVEYVMLFRSRNECKDVIAYMKANASVFLSLEFIASDNERQRCVDMLSGAAYTLGCALNKISPCGIYLISSPSVRVVMDPAMQKFTSVPESQPYARASYGAGPYENFRQQPRQEEAEMQPVTANAGGSPTMRFQAQGTQRMPTSFGNVMSGNATGMFAPIQQQPRSNYAPLQ